MRELNVITGKVIDAAYRIHTELGPGLKESVYEMVLAREVMEEGLFVERQKWISFDYRGLWFQDACRADIIIDKAVIIEVKSTKKLAPRDAKQLLTYLRLTDCRVGLVLNFGAALMKDGIKRVVNDFEDGNFHGKRPQQSGGSTATNPAPQGG